MVNAFKIKRNIAILAGGCIPAIFFFLALKFSNNILIALAGLAGGLVWSFVIGILMLKNPFSDMLEGKGILALNLDSAGIIRPFIVKVKQPFISGKFDGKPINDTFDRNAIFQMAVPKKSSGAAIPQENGGISITLGEEEYNKARFALFHYPVVLWNAQIKSVITKDFIGLEERAAFAEHGVLYLNRKVEELTSSTRDFGRYVVEMIKPKAGFLSSPWAKYILIGGVVILLIMLAPSIIGQIKGFMAGEGASQAAGVLGGSNNPIVRP